MHGPKGGRIPPNFPSPLLLLSLQPPIIKNDVNKMLNMKINELVLNDLNKPTAVKLRKFLM